MLLVLTNQGDATADYLCGRMSAASVPFVRLDTDVDLRRLEVGYVLNTPTLQLDGKGYAPRDFQNVWLRRPERLTIRAGADEAEQRHVAGEWAGAIEGFLAHIAEPHWMNHPARNAQAGYKLEQLSRAAEHGLIVPSTLVTQDLTAASEFYDKCAGKVLVKPITAGHLERDDPNLDTVIYTNQVSRERLLGRGDVLRNCPTLFQEIVDKACDVRLRVRA